MKKYLTRHHISAGIAFCAIIGLYLCMLRPSVAGFLYDDGIYLMGARALAAGKGYVMDGVVGSPAIYKYPPAFPAVLAPFWMLFPSFPENIVFFKALNISFAVTALALLFYYCLRIRDLDFTPSLLLTVFFATNLRWVEVSTELMSEPLFMVFALGLILWTHHLEKTHAEKQGRVQWFILLLLALATVYTRTTGLLLVLAVSIWLWKRLGRKATLWFSGAWILGLIPWGAWNLSRPDTTGQIGDFLVRSFQESYAQVLLMDLRYEYSPIELYVNGFTELFGKLSITLLPLLERLLPEYDLLILMVSLALTGYLLFQATTRFKEHPLGICGLYLILYLALLPAWSFHDQYPRLLIVVVPFLTLAVVEVFGAFLASPRLRAQLLTAALAVGIATNLYHLSPYLFRTHPNALSVSSAQQDLWTDYTHVFKTLKDVSQPGDVVWTDNTQETIFLSLYSNRFAPDFFLFYGKPITLIQSDPSRVAAQLFTEKAHALFELLQTRRVRFILVNHRIITRNQYNSGLVQQKTEPTTRIMLELYPQYFRKIDQSPGLHIELYEITPPETGYNMTYTSNSI